MSITVKDGVATIEQSLGGTFIGSSGEGKFPPRGHRYGLLTFEPKRGEPGIIVFCDEMMTRSVCKGEAPWLHLFQYEWSGSKLIVHWGIKNPARAYTESRGLGLVVQVRDWYYITGPVTDRDYNYKQVDLFEMLKYIEGKIDLKELDHNARSYERRQKHLERLTDHRKEIRRLEQENESLSGGHELLMSRCETLEERMRFYQARFQVFHYITDRLVAASIAWKVLRHLPVWLRPKYFNLHATAQVTLAALSKKKA